MPATAPRSALGRRATRVYADARTARQRERGQAERVAVYESASMTHFAFRHDGDLSGSCLRCSNPLEAHTHYVLDDDGPEDFMCTVAPVTHSVVQAVRSKPAG